MNVFRCALQYDTNFLHNVYGVWKKKSINIRSRKILKTVFPGKRSGNGVCEFF